MGTFMVFTTDEVTGCSTSRMNHVSAVWDGAAWVVQYLANGCPKMFANAQVAFPLHRGGVRYRRYYGDPSVTEGRGTSTLPFPGPKKLIFADGTVSGSASLVDFEDWEAQSSARDAVFLWQNGDQMSANAEGSIDDYHLLTADRQPGPSGDIRNAHRWRDPVLLRRSDSAEPVAAHTRGCQS